MKQEVFQQENEFSKLIACGICSCDKKKNCCKKYKKKGVHCKKCPKL